MLEELQLSPEQQLAQEAAVLGVAQADGFEAANKTLQRLHEQRTWLSPPLLLVGAALLTVAGVGPGNPWAYDEAVWNGPLSHRRPAGKAEWGHFNFALQAAGCLAAGLWLDVSRHESFSHMPLWPFALDAIEVLTGAARELTGLSSHELSFRLAVHLGLDAKALTP